MLLIVTRPAAQAADWVARLRELGQPAQALPLIAIEPVADPAPVRAAWAGLGGQSLVVFVSANAVAAFFALAPRVDARAMGWPAGVLAGSTGPGTSAALRAAGVAAETIVEPAADAPAFDSEALWSRLAARPWAGRRVLVVRGEDGRDWLADTLRAAGAVVDFVAAYARRAPRLDDAQRELLNRARDNPAAHLWLFSSSQAVRHLQQLAPSADWSAAQAIASHPRIVQAVSGAGFGRVEPVPPLPQAVAERAAAWQTGDSPPLQ